MNPDGDALGSSFGLAGYLSDIGKDVRIFLPNEPSESLSFMVPERFRDKILSWQDNRSERLAEEVEACDLLIGLDFNTPERIGGYESLLKGSKAFKILVDHHVAPAAEYFDMVFSKTDTSSTCEFLYCILKTMPEIGGDAGRMNAVTRESLMTGMTTDTNNFANSTTPDTFLMASELIAAGTDREKIIHSLFFRYPERRLRAQGYILDKLLKITEDGVAYIIIDRRVQKKFNLQDGDTEGFVNIPLSLDKVRMSILLKRELHGKKIRISIRSKKGTSARNLAMQHFHGGGHEQASGGRLMVGEDIRNMRELPAYVENCTHKFFMER